MSTLQYVLSTALVLVVFVATANAVVDLYARGAVRAAIDEAARAGARVDAGTADCRARAAEVLAGLVGSRIRSGVTIRCAADDALMTARAEVRLASWLAPMPDWTFTLVGTAVRERLP